MQAQSPRDLEPIIRDLAGKVASYESRTGRVNESNTIRALVTPMIAALGWDIHDLDEVQSEYRHASTDNPVDYALFLDGAPALFVEAKALQERLDDRKWIVQTLNYANACNVEWAVLTNGVEWRVYNVHAKVEAEDKLFYAARIDVADVVETARRLSFLSKPSMAPKRALNQLWQEASVDRAMRAVIEGLPENRAAIRAMAKASEGLSEMDVKDALRRLGLRADWRDEDDLFPRHGAVPRLRERGEVNVTPVIEDIPLGTDLSSAALGPAPAATKIRMSELLAAGCLAPGDQLRLRAKPDEICTIVDNKTCDYRGTRLSYNQWGCAATGWTAIQIYVRVETMDGRLLQDLRQDLASRGHPAR